MIKFLAANGVHVCLLLSAFLLSLKHVHVGCDRHNVHVHVHVHVGCDRNNVHVHVGCDRYNVHVYM